MRMDNKSSKILIVDDEFEYREVLQMIVESRGYTAETAASGIEALGMLEKGAYRMVLTDLMMEGMSGIELMDKIKADYNKIEVIIITGYGTIENAVLAMKKGAAGYFVKGHEPSELLCEIEKAFGNYEADRSLGEAGGSYILQTANSQFKKVIHIAEKAAMCDINILLLGESGVGKEVFSRHIYECSERSSKPFVAVNCQAFSDGLLESELFGHEKGAFTGATDQRKGRFELAHGGTLLLDEIGDISLSTQVKLLRTIETKVVERLGGNHPINVDFRLICATNKDLQSEIKRGAFREDFFYRISTITLEIPPLRERKEDLPMLIDFFLKKSNEKFRRSVSKIEDGVMEFLQSYDYPGNIRELKNIIERSVVLSENSVLSKKYMPEISERSHRFEEPFEEVRPLKDIRKDVEKKYIRKVLEICEDNLTEAAEKLDISRRQLFNKMVEYGLR